jgi:hypothetical protein
VPSERKDIWDKVSVGATAIAALFVPVILALAANALNASLKDKELKVEVMKLAEDLLKSDPTNTNQPGVRDWAKRVLSEYSGIQLSEAAKEELDKQPLLGSSSTENHDRDPMHLHPALRDKIAVLLQRLEQEGLHFELFDGFRSPSMQLIYYSRGQSSSKPWSGKHSFGVAADLVLIRGKQMIWDSEGAAGYERMHEVAKELGLRTIEGQFSDPPHVELDGISVADLQAGKYPPGGDVPWASNLAQSAENWTRLIAAVQAWGGALPAAPVPPEIPK